MLPLEQDLIANKNRNYSDKYACNNVYLINILIHWPIDHTFAFVFVKIRPQPFRNKLKITVFIITRLRGPIQEQTYSSE